MNYSTSTSPASLHRRELLRELSDGHRAAEILRRRFLRAPSSSSSSPPLPGTDDPVSDSALVEVISKSFDISLAILNNWDPLSVLDDCKIEGSCGGGGDGDETASRIKDRRGCYKRRKRGQAWTAEGEAPNEDGYQWRKYGQKMILNSKFPRNYYRCTHKMDQGCQAVKQVQKTSEEPPHYKTTYSGNHTCKNPHKAPQIIIPSLSTDPQTDSCFLLSFDRTSNNVNNNNINPFFQSSHNSMAVKQEHLAANTANAVASTQALMMPMMPILMNNNSSSTSDYNYLSSTPVGSDHGGDVISTGEYSCSASPSSFDTYMIDHLAWDI